MEQILHTLHEFVWSPGMLAFFLLTGIYFTVQSKFYSILRIKQWFGQTLGSLFKNPQVRNTGSFAVSVFLYSTGSNAWYRKYHRGCNCDNGRRSRLYLLDVDFCSFGNDDQLCGKLSGNHLSL